MTVDGDRRDVKSVPQDDRCRLATHPMEAREALHRSRDDAAELAEDLLRARSDRFGLLTEEARRMDVGLKLGKWDLEIGVWTSVLLEEGARHEVHALVLRLGGEDRG